MWIIEDVLDLLVCLYKTPSEAFELEMIQHMNFVSTIPVIEDGASGMELPQLNTTTDVVIKDELSELNRNNDVVMQQALSQRNPTNYVGTQDGQQTVNASIRFAAMMMNRHLINNMKQKIQNESIKKDSMQNLS
ncbi:uncharacterized protein LOC119674599 isoform X2 [Teleopsis dalmanni]|uniref:uncharacterized protein LOC119674599 isoform X2 n=1 Tax=Teleopsis dalmanni TaxID=139649 RepID=UPI0018CF604E|nr:uncharacterized protein LOC119674599 isoform X2 [Teleopsis dalmanni]